MLVNLRLGHEEVRKERDQAVLRLFLLRLLAQPGLIGNLLACSRKIEIHQRVILHSFIIINLTGELSSFAKRSSGLALLCLLHGYIAALLDHFIKLDLWFPCLGGLLRILLVPAWATPGYDLQLRWFLPLARSCKWRDAVEVGVRALVRLVLKTSLVA